MRENRLIIICVTIIVCVALVCGTIFLTHNSNQEHNTNNTTNNNTTVNSTINDTNNTNNTTTAKTSSSKSSSKKNSSSSGDDVATVDSNGNRIYRDGEWVGRGAGGSHIYKDKKTGELFDSGGKLPNNYKYNPK